MTNFTPRIHIQPTVPSTSRRSYNNSRVLRQEDSVEEDHDNILPLIVHQDEPAHAKPELVKYLETVQQALKIAVRLKNKSNNDSRSPTYHYVIVTSIKHLYKHYNKICVFMGILEEEGFELTIATSILKDGLIFVLIHASDEVYHHFAKLHGIDLMCEWNESVLINTKLPYKFMATELTKPNYASSTVYSRARKTISGKKPTEITAGEKAMIISKVLSSTQTGMDTFDIGVDELIKTGVFKAAFPLHDGDWEWSDKGELNDRQLLAKYWASAKCWYKQQPLDLIQKYYGTEVAFYFAWVGFYNRMLIPASVIGILCFIYSLVTMFTTLNQPSKELCASNIILCPKCRGYCKFSYLNKSCLYSMITYLCDNEATVFFGVLMSFWATAFMQLWNREQAVLQIRWNVRNVEMDETERPEFVQNVRRIRTSRVTGKPELYEPAPVICFRYALTTSAIVFMMIFVICAFLSIMVYQTALIYWMKNKHMEGPISNTSVELMASSAASVVTVIFIMIFQMIYSNLSAWLTKMENPRTQMEYDHSYIYKSYTLSFVNGYATTFYIAFFKGKFFTHPGNINSSFFGTFHSDLCDPAGCIVNLSIQLGSVVVIRYIFGNVVEVAMPILCILINKMKAKNIDEKSLSIWEKDYLLNPVGYFHLLQEYTELIVQYGYVIFFVAAFPLAPFLALLNNLAEIRIDAQKYLFRCRRPIPKRVSGIGAWNGILQGATYLGVVTNAFVIAFTSGFVERHIYKYLKNSNLVGFVNSTLSEFKIADGDFDLPTGDLTTCYYDGKRYPPDHEKRYQHTEDYWFEVLVRFAVVLIFEHMVMILLGILSYSIPNIPRSVRQHLSYQLNSAKEKRAQSLREDYKESRKGVKSNKISFRKQCMALSDDFF